MNTMKAVLVAVAITVVTVAGGVVGAQGGSSKSNMAQQTVLKSGEYRDLTFFRKLKLGVAPYVNPKLLTEAKIVYRYDIGEVMPHWDDPSFWMSLEDGKAALGYVDPQSKNIMIGADYVTEEQYADILDAMYGGLTPEEIAALEKDWVLVYPDSKWLGVTSMDAAVSWAPGPEIVTPFSPKRAPKR